VTGGTPRLVELSEIRLKSLRTDHINLETLKKVRPSGHGGVTVSGRVSRSIQAGDSARLSDRAVAALPGARHQGLLYAEGVSDGDHWDVTPWKTAEINHILNAIRLATATTSRPNMIWTGEPSWVHIELPLANPQPDDFFESSWRRVAAIEPEQLDGLSRMAAMLGSLEENGTRTVPAVIVSVWRYARSFRMSSWQDTVLDLATALEACFGPNHKEEIGLTLRTRAAHLLAPDDANQAEAIYTDVQDLYGLRSDVIHGNPKLRRTLPQLWEARGYEHVLDTDRLYVLMDRWRDIVRRAITARLMLADPSLGDPLWPMSGNGTNVDGCLVRSDARAEWRQRIVDGSVAYRLPFLADQAPPLIDYLHTP
jgi:Apea-like HEPN